MYKKPAALYYLSLITIFLVVIGTGCRSSKNIAYFKDIRDSIYTVPQTKAVSNFTDPIIQSNDILSISVLTMEDNEVLNAASKRPVSSVSAASGAEPTFLVDHKGEVEIPVVGKIKVSGLTSMAARDTIHNRMALLYKNPVVNVRFANFTITVMGEVFKPGVYTIANEKVSILDIIALAGDLTIDAKRENILLVRDSVGQKLFTRFNLNSSTQLLGSPYFYLRQGDVVYIEPSKYKATNSSFSRNVALLGIAASVITALVVIFK